MSANHNEREKKCACPKFKHKNTRDKKCSIKNHNLCEKKQLYTILVS